MSGQIGSPFAVDGKKSAGVLVGGLCASVIASFVNNGINAQVLPGVLDTLLTVGAPTAVGILAVNALDSEAESKPLIASLLAGSIGVAAMISVGALPATVDAQTLALIAICGSGAYVAEWIAKTF
jgi:hypothetical protein